MRLNILLDAPTCYGGIQQFSRNLAAMLKNDFEVRLLAYSGALPALKECPHEIVRLCRAEERRGLSRFLRGGAEVYLRPGIRKLAAHILDIPGIRKRIREELPGDEILLINSIHSMHLFVPLEVLLRNRVVFVQHNSPEQLRTWRYDFGGWLRPQKIALFNRVADAMVMLSPQEQPYFERYLNLSGKLIRVIRHETTLPPESGLPYPKTKTVMFLGRLTRQKRVDRILEVARQAPDFHFNIYGDGPEEKLLHQMARNLKNVTFHGYVRDLWRPMSENALAVFTSDFEGYPISGIECVAWGKPLIGLNRFPAAVDLVRDGETGFLLDSFDPQRFAEALRKLHQNLDSYRQNSLQLRCQYDPKKIQTEWKTFLHDLLQRELRKK